jgi:hypothetical protein
MAKMEDETLLSHLQALEQDSSHFVWGKLGAEREQAMKEYFRRPYGNEEEGWSSIVTSEVQDTVEWILPALLKVFTSTDKAVSFEPTREQEVKGAEQATDTCNYVFYKQNNGFLVLYTAIKDALTVKNCAVMWRKETKRVKSVVPATGATAEMLSMLLRDAGEGAEIESATPNPPQPVMGPQGPMIDPATGQPVMGPQTFNARICKIEKRTTIRVDAFAPEELLVKRDWVSPLLHECPYVARNMLVSLSDLHEMGFDDVTAEDLAESRQPSTSADSNFRQSREGASDIGYADNPTLSSDDPSMTQGYMRLEYVLVDFDGDGIAERREIYRLKDKILRNEEVSHVPVATASPILVPHRWDGMSVAETVSDLQQLKTELTRQVLNSAYLANNPRSEVLTDSNWSPMANIDDLLDSRPGGVIRKKQVDAIKQNVVPFVGGQMLPLLDYVDSMGERRTGVSRQRTGMDPNALQRDRTLGDAQMMNSAVMERIELIARVMAETLLKPIFQGILKLLTDGEMQKMAFRLRGEFVEYDPNEWRDSYDMTINVGLGTGDRNEQQGHLQALFQIQGAVSASPLGGLLVKPKNVYNVLAKMVENAGFKNVGDFFIDPKDQMPPPPPNPMQGEMAKIQMEMQAKGQMHAAGLQQDAQIKQLQMRQEAQLEQMRAQMQAEVDRNRQASEAEQQSLKIHQEAQLSALKAQHEQERHLAEMQFQQWKAHLDAATKIEVANIMSKAKVQDAATVAATDEVTEGLSDGV